MPQLHNIGGSTSGSTASKTETLFTDEDLTDNLEHKSSGIDVEKIRHKTFSYLLTHTGTITDYFVVAKFQSADEDVDANYRTIIEHECEDDCEHNLHIEDCRKYARMTITSEGTAGAADYVTINAAVDALGE